ncbi:hypothetical protein DYD21_19925 [Rhodohalobacter sp. SW132]|uniref:hypothetical protein n=1 Tax=Rhodohalobacter sp. SW132 TaxID=2293433 RepID=UPI000E226606|nr:hypothetical protein [Rhodohalobacter sp. SW132]REL24080.1 hypothetical protein DYD21_19925 [Rhodohalobacter sp. SW132]
MKKIALFTLLSLFFAHGVYAQEATETIDVTATVESALEFVTNPAVVEFGNIQSGQQAVVDSNPLGSADINATTPQRAQISIQNALNEAFSVTFGNGILASVSNSHTISFVPSIYVVSGTSVNGSTSNDETLTSGNTIEADGTGENIILSIGGSLEAVDAIHSGSYSTTEAGGQSVTIEFTLTTL